MKKIIIYGVGVNCDAFMRYAKKLDFDIVAYVDKNKAGELYRGSIIKQPESISDINFDEVFLMVGENTAPIKDYLIHEIGVKEEQIKDTYYLNKQYMLCGMEDYKYVLINARAKQYEILYSDLNKNKDVFVSCLLLCENRWRLDLCEETKRKPQIIILLQGYGMSCECVQYFKDKFPDAKVVMAFNDMVSGENGYNKVFKNFSLDKFKEIADLITTYHLGEAKIYDLYYYPQIFSKINLAAQSEKYDVFFTGLAKNRLDTIHSVYKKMTSEGLVCRFWISDVQEEQMLEEHEGIIYNQKLTYEEYLNEVMKSRCILDIVQIGDVHSTRYTEAVVYNKKYLSNDLSVKEDTYYKEEYMQVFDTVENLNCNWIKANIDVDYEYKGEFSPLNFIKTLEERFLQ